MRITFTVAISILSSVLLSCTQIPSSSSASYVDTYPQYEQTSNYKKVFVTAQGVPIVDYYLSRKFKFDDLEYTARVRVIGEEYADTAYFRNAQEGLVYVDPVNLVETIDLPKNPVVGQKWQEPTNWIYEVKSVNARLKTPLKEYTNLVEIEAIQTTGETKDKFHKYNNFYADKVGFVATIVNGELYAYLLKEVEITSLPED